MNVLDDLVRLWNRVLLRTLFESAKTLLGGWTLPMSEWLVIRASRRLPARVADECRKQWLADLYGLPGWLQLRSAVSLLTSRDLASLREPRCDSLSKAMQSASHAVAIEAPPLPLSRDSLTYDGLTGLYNRRTRDLGHLAGDALLREFARRLRGALCGRGHIGRFGEDRFAVLLRHTPTLTALQVAEHLRCACDFPADDLWSHAAFALGQAKRAGRNCVRHFEPG